MLPPLQTPRVVALAARTTKFRTRIVLRRSLVVGQIAISMVLLADAAPIGCFSRILIQHCVYCGETQPFPLTQLIHRYINGPHYRT
jgi:hypothetical protein